MIDDDDKKCIDYARCMADLTAINLLKDNMSGFDEFWSDEASIYETLKNIEKVLKEWSIHREHLYKLEQKLMEVEK